MDGWREVSVKLGDWRGGVHLCVCAGACVYTCTGAQSVRSLPGTGQVPDCSSPMVGMKREPRCSGISPGTHQACRPHSTQLPAQPLPPSGPNLNRLTVALASSWLVSISQHCCPSPHSAGSPPAPSGRPRRDSHLVTPAPFPFPVFLHFRPPQC